MGREIRRVPADWEHPRDERTGDYKAILDEAFDPAFSRWCKNYQLWKQGKHPDQPRDCEFWEWEGDPPSPEYYHPDWDDATHYQMYETTSEGTPISPVFATPEEVARYCADNNVSAFADITATYEEWLRVANGGYACSAVIEKGKLDSGVAALTDKLESPA